MKIQFHNQPSSQIDQIEADMIALGFCEEERPLRGTLGYADWRLEGFISKSLLQSKIVGKLGETVLIPTKEKLSAPWLLLVGLGSSLELGEQESLRFGELALARAYGMKSQRVAMFYPYHFTRPPRDRTALKNLLAGISNFAVNCKDSSFLDPLTLLVPSHKKEEVDLANVVLQRLIAEHSLRA